MFFPVTPRFRRWGSLVFWMFPLLVSPLVAEAQASSAVVVAHLRVEYRVNPLGLGVAKPRLSWELQSKARGEIQNAYQVLVASSPDLLGRDKGDLWDSGKVASSQSNQLIYAGSDLKTGQPVWWKVRVWGRDGQPSAWSETGWWTMGLLSRDDWKARWIGDDAAYEKSADAQADDKRFATAGLSWVSYPPAQWTKEAHTNYLRKIVKVDAGRKVKRAVIALYADNSATVSVNGHDVGQAMRWEKTARLDVTSALQAGDNVVGIVISNSDYLPPAAIGRLVIQYASGDDQAVPLDGTWKIAQEPVKDWDQAGFDDHAWVAAAASPDTPWGTPALNDIARNPAPYLRKEFNQDKPVKRATIYVTALGVYELHLNGAKVGRDVLTPGWSDFRKRVFYQTYDVTGQMKSGANALGAILGDGWYASDLAFTGRRNDYGGKPRLIAQLVIENADGSSQTITTDGSWKASFGPILHDDLLLGSAYDARLALHGWDRAGYDEHAWVPVDVGDNSLPTPPGAQGPPAPPPGNPEDGIELDAQVGDPVRTFEELPALKLTEPKPGDYIFDLGQDMVGWTRLKTSGARGQRLTVRHGEMLNPDGTLYTANLRGATATDFYTLAGKGVETFEPYFTFHGFRYVEVRGLAGKPGLDAITGLVVHSPMQRTGEFACSNPLIDKLYHNIIWGQKGNYLDIPTDCPQRDERMGWTGDTQFFVPTAAYNFDVAGFFDRWLIAMARDAQLPNGSYAHVAPDMNVGGGATAWGDAAIICTWNMYHSYGDTANIAAYFGNFEKAMQYLESKTDPDGITHMGGFEDWLNKGGGAADEVIDTAYHAYLAGLMADMARAIGNNEAAKRYQDTREHEVKAFATFFNPDGSFKNITTSDGKVQLNSQTAYALAFTMGLVPDDLKEAATHQFVGQIRQFHNHLATGFIGTPRLLPGLHLAGRDDVAYQLLDQDTYPSWLFQVKIGATTMWERWDGWTPDHGFQSIGMNSFNHYAFGAVGQYLYGVIGGIQADSPGYKTIRIAPVPGGGLTRATTSYDSIYGLISSAWKLSGRTLTLNVTIPPNTSATIYVPSQDPSKVTESGKPPGEGIQFLREEKGAAVYSVGAGTYHFVSTIPGSE